MDLPLKVCVKEAEHLAEYQARNIGILKYLPKKWVACVIGYTFSGGAYWGAFVSIQLVFDGHGNQGILITAGAMITAPSVSFTVSPFFSWGYKSIYDLVPSMGYVIGGGVGAPIYGGVDLLFNTKGKFTGIQVNVGVAIDAGVKYDVKAGGSVSVLITSWNVWDIFNSLTRKFKK